MVFEKGHILPSAQTLSFNVICQLDESRRSFSGSEGSISPELFAMKGWGHLTKVYGQVSYGISPFEQKLFKGFFNKTLYNWLGR